MSFRCLGLQTTQEVLFSLLELGPSHLCTTAHVVFSVDHSCLPLPCAFHIITLFTELPHHVRVPSLVAVPCSWSNLPWLLPFWLIPSLYPIASHLPFQVRFFDLFCPKSVYSSSWSHCICIEGLLWSGSRAIHQTNDKNIILSSRTSWSCKTGMWQTLKYIAQQDLHKMCVAQAGSRTREGVRGRLGTRGHGLNLSLEG